MTIKELKKAERIKDADLASWFGYNGDVAKTFFYITK